MEEWNRDWHAFHSTGISARKAPELSHPPELAVMCQRYGFWLTRRAGGAKDDALLINYGRRRLKRTWLEEGLECALAVDVAQLSDGEGLEVHGNPNVLTQDVGTSRLGQGSAALSALVQIEKWKGELPAVTAFDPPKVAVQSPKPF